MEHPLQAGLERYLQRHDLVYKGPFRCAFYTLGRLSPTSGVISPTIGVIRSLIYVAAPEKRYFPYKHLHKDLGLILESLIPDLENLPKGSWKNEYFRINVGVATITYNAPVHEIEFDKDEYCIPLFRPKEEPFQKFPSGTKFTPNDLTYDASIFLYPYVEVMDRSWQECFIRNPIEEITREELKKLQRKYAPSIWQRIFKLSR